MVFTTDQIGDLLVEGARLEGAGLTFGHRGAKQWAIAPDAVSADPGEVEVWRLLYGPTMGEPGAVDFTVTRYRAKGMVGARHVEMAPFATASGVAAVEEMATPSAVARMFARLSSSR